MLLAVRKSNYCVQENLCCSVLNIQFSKILHPLLRSNLSMMQPKMRNYNLGLGSLSKIVQQSQLGGTVLEVLACCVSPLPGKNKATLFYFLYSVSIFLFYGINGQGAKISATHSGQVPGMLVCRAGRVRSHNCSLLLPQKHLHRNRSLGGCSSKSRSAMPNLSFLPLLTCLFSSPMTTIPSFLVLKLIFNRK